MGTFAAAEVPTAKQWTRGGKICTMRRRRRQERKTKGYSKDTRNQGEELKVRPPHVSYREWLMG
jgi:hypothetical protein